VGGDGIDRLLAIASEHEAEIGYICRRDAETAGALIRVFEENEEFARIDVTTESGESIQVVIRGELLFRRLTDPQTLPHEPSRKGSRPVWEDLEV
jgi:hypothetical protein